MCDIAVFLCGIESCKFLFRQKWKILNKIDEIHANVGQKSMKFCVRGQIRCEFSSKIDEIYANFGQKLMKLR